ncbi:TIGR03862 family flavoprotein [Pseudoxanthomonas sp. GM95]|uniref:TIGR03862 family flavoprotein n=1 Tax=Pseudoxanthomonas sp. GM95 TaxID=1881043 RepID=UPI000B824339|nr:TIGR03862 family flavoprotein [Pseudoxanthomonas sp. GM95]
MSAAPLHARTLAIIGGGPAGLMAAETARAAGLSVDLYEAKGSVGRKFLIAGKGGMNLTHSETRPGFDARYRERAGEVGAWLDDFDAEALRAWAAGLGVETFVGSSGRVFPTDLKAAPLLRGWVRRLKEQGVRFHVQHRWTGWADDGALRFDTPDGALHIEPDATVLALGGASWPQLGSDGAWQPWLAARGVEVAPLKPANCGFDIAFSAHMAKHAGAPLKPVVAHWRDAQGNAHAQQGECVLTETGIEGSVIYAIAPDLREAIERDGSARLELDLAPGRDLDRLMTELSRPRKGRSIGDHLRRAAGIEGPKAALVFEVTDAAARNDPAQLAAAIHRLPLTLQRARPVAETISSAGGVRLEALDAVLMLAGLPGTFCAGEMLDWEAPTGGYLLTACFASGRRAAKGATAWLQGL